MAGLLHSRGGVPVYADYRDNIIVDPDHPILAWKARKEIFSPGLFPASVQKLFPLVLARIGSQHSEDALTWNVFRTLQLARMLRVVTDAMAPKEEFEILYLWGHNAGRKSQDIDHDIQDCLNQVEPWGRNGAKQQTETDVMLRGKEHLIVVECKLGKPGEIVKAWSRSRVGMRPEYATFMKDLGLKLFADSFNYEHDGNRFYQLFRNYLLGAALGLRWNTKFSLLAIVNGLNSNVERRSHQDEFACFRSVLVDPTNAFLITWQQVWNALPRERNLLRLHEFMANHPLLALSKREARD